MDNGIDFDLTDEEKEQLNDSYTPTPADHGFEMHQIDMSEEDLEMYLEMIGKYLNGEITLPSLDEWLEEIQKKASTGDSFDRAMRGI